MGHWGRGWLYHLVMDLRLRMGRRHSGSHRLSLQILRNKPTPVSILGHWTVVIRTLTVGTDAPSVISVIIALGHYCIGCHARRALDCVIHFRSLSQPGTGQIHKKDRIKWEVKPQRDRRQGLIWTSSDEGKSTVCLRRRLLGTLILRCSPDNQTESGCAHEQL